MKSLVNKKKQKLLAKAKGRAFLLQCDYTELDAPPTQNVRNPFPMWAIVQAAMPNIPKTVKAQVTMTAVINGRRMTRTSVEEVPSVKFLGEEAYNNAGKTVNEITKEILENGFLANRQTVSQTINTLIKQGLVTKVRHTRPSTFPNRKASVSFCKYFMQES
jgi:hypothetical protein